jgi:hypothetical protein
LSFRIPLFGTNLPPCLRRVNRQAGNPVNIEKIISWMLRGACTERSECAQHDRKKQICFLKTILSIPSLFFGRGIWVYLRKSSHNRGNLLSFFMKTLRLRQKTSSLSTSRRQHDYIFSSFWVPFCGTKNPGSYYWNFPGSFSFIAGVSDSSLAPLGLRSEWNCLLSFRVRFPDEESEYPSVILSASRRFVSGRVQRGQVEVWRSSNSPMFIWSRTSTHSDKEHRNSLSVTIFFRHSESRFVGRRIQRILKRLFPGCFAGAQHDNEKKF